MGLSGPCVWTLTGEPRSAKTNNPPSSFPNMRSLSLLPDHFVISGILCFTGANPFARPAQANGLTCSGIVPRFQNQPSPSEAKIVAPASIQMLGGVLEWRMDFVWLCSYEIEQVGDDNPGLDGDGEQKKPGIQSRASFMLLQLER